MTASRLKKKSLTAAEMKQTNMYLQKKYNELLVLRIVLNIQELKKNTFTYHKVTEFHPVLSLNQTHLLATLLATLAHHQTVLVRISRIPCIYKENRQEGKRVRQRKKTRQLVGVETGTMVVVAVLDV